MSCSITFSLTSFLYALHRRFMFTSSDHYLCFRRKTQTLCWITWQWLYRVDLQHLPLCTCEWIFQHDILVESSYAKSHIKWYKCILWNYCIAPWNPTPHMLFCLCHVKICSGKKAPHVLLFFLSCAGQKFPGKTFQLSHMFVLLLSFESHYFNISIHHSRLHVLQQDHFCFHILWSFVTVNMFLGLFSLKGSLTSQESNCLIWTIPFL